MILTTEEAVSILGYNSIDDAPLERINIILPAIDDSIKIATGRDWGEDSKIDPLSKIVANVLLVRWFEDPGLIGNVNDSALIGLIGQLHAKALGAMG